jgi:hypothetical protein
MGVRDRAVRGCAVVLAVLFGTAAPAAAAASAPVVGERTAGQVTEPGSGVLADQVTVAERAAAMAEPAIVLIEVRWAGQVRHRETGEVIDPDPVSASIRCTGAGVGSKGFLVTTAACLSEASAAAAALQQVVDRRVADGSVAPDDAADLLGELLTTATISSDPDDPSERTVSVRRAVTDDGPMPATVVAVADPLEGDAALLKIHRNNQPVLPLAQDIAVGDEVFTLECPVGEEGWVVAPAPSAGPQPQEPVRPRFRVGAVAELEPRMHVQPVGIAAAALPGGVVLSADAGLVGLVDVRLPEWDLVVDASVIRDLMDEADADNSLGQVDRDYRAGLDDYFAGRYTESIERFDSVLAIIPSHVQAHAYRDDAQTLRAAQGGGPANSDDAADRLRRWIKGRSGMLVGLGVLAAILVFLLNRRRPHPDGPQAAEPSEATGGLAARNERGADRAEPASPRDDAGNGGSAGDDTAADGGGERSGSRRPGPGAAR